MKRILVNKRELSLSVLLAISGLLLIIFSNSSIAFIVFVLLSLFALFHDIYKLIFKDTEIKLSKILAISIMLGYCSGSFIYLTSYKLWDPTHYQIWAHQGLYYNQLGLSYGLAICLISVVTLKALSLFETGINIKKILAVLPHKQTEWLVWFGGLTALAALLNGDIRYMGAAVSESGAASAIGLILNLVVPALIPISVALLISRSQSSIKKLATLCSLLIFTAVLLLLGRRYLLYVALLVAIVLRNHTANTFGNNRSLFTYGFLSAILIYWGFKFFMALRLAVWQEGLETPIANLLSVTLDNLINESQSIQQKLAETSGSRPFILAYLGGLISLDSNNMPTYGSELLYALKMSTPSVFMPGKTATLPSTSEALIHPLYGLLEFDGPNSFIVAGYNDFGTVGAVLYPMLVCLIYYSFFSSIKRIFRDQAISALTIFTILFQLLYIEQSFGGVFVTIRNLTLILTIVWFARRLSRIKHSAQSLRAL